MDQRQGPNAKTQPGGEGGAAEIEVVEVKAQLWIKAHPCPLQAAGAGREEHPIQEGCLGGAGPEADRLVRLGIAMADRTQQIGVVPGAAVGQEPPGGLAGDEPLVPATPTRSKGSSACSQGGNRPVSPSHTSSWQNTTRL